MVDERGARVVLVTGGAGFIGSSLVRELLARPGTRVVDLDALTYAADAESLRELPADRHELVHGDVADAACVRDVFEQRAPDAVLHLAAETHVDRSLDDAGAFVRTNVLGTQVLLDASLRHWRSLPAKRRETFRFVQVSTDEVYGSLGATGRFVEDSPIAPSSPYAASKAAADLFVAACWRSHGLPTVTLRCGNNLGPRQFPEKLVPLTILNALDGLPLRVYGDGSQVRDWIHVEDHCRAIATALDRGRPGATYLVGGRSERTNLAVVRGLCDALDALVPSPGGSRRELITFVEDRPGHDTRYALDDSRFRAETGWAPLRTFDDALAATVRWYLDHPDWCARVRSGADRGERLGLGGRR